MFVVAKTREESRSAPPSTSAVDALQPPRGSLAVSPTPPQSARASSNGKLATRRAGDWHQNGGSSRGTSLAHGFEQTLAGPCLGCGSSLRVLGRPLAEVVFGYQQGPFLPNRCRGGSFAASRSAQPNHGGSSFSQRPPPSRRRRSLALCCSML